MMEEHQAASVQLSSSGPGSGVGSGVGLRQGGHGQDLEGKGGMVGSGLGGAVMEVEKEEVVRRIW